MADTEEPFVFINQLTRTITVTIHPSWILTCSVQAPLANDVLNVVGIDQRTVEIKAMTVLPSAETLTS